MTFIRKDFYSEPPARDATPEEWNTWIARDTRQAAAAKAVHTKSLEHTDTPTWLVADAPWQSGGLTSVKAGGITRQSQAVGFIGSPEEGTVQVERIDTAPGPDILIDIRAAVETAEAARHKRGGRRRGKSARRRANRRKS